MRLASIKDIFNFENKQLRVYGTADNPWFCGKDVCNILEYKNTNETINKFVDKEYINILKNLKGSESLPLKGNLKNSIYINEQGLYCLIFNSKMEKAKLFRKWIFEEVLPSIRKNGYYVAPNINDEKIEQLTNELKKKEKALHEKIDELENSKKKMIRLNDFIASTKELKKEEIFYIATTDVYARNNRLNTAACLV